MSTINKLVPGLRGIILSAGSNSFFCANFSDTPKVASTVPAAKQVGVEGLFLFGWLFKEAATGGRVSASDQDLAAIGNHLPKRHILSFHPQPPHSGSHVLTLNLPDYEGLEVTARTS